MKFTDWHKLFGITLTDFFTDTAYTVELEKDLSLKKQFPDIVIIEKKEGQMPDELPDGLLKKQCKMQNAKCKMYSL